MTTRDPSVTVLLRAWRDGDRNALDELMPLVYAQLRALAADSLRRERHGHTLATGDLVSEAFLRLAGQAQPDFADRAHFFAIATRVVRQVLVDHARRRAAEKRGAGGQPVTLAEHAAVSTERPEDLVAVDRALEALAGDDERKARVVEMAYFGGMSQPEIAAVLGLHVNTVGRELKLGKAWLARLLAEAA
jgi:RNA polymerase sigma factor (TIGR02999 family)